MSVCGTREYVHVRVRAYVCVWVCIYVRACVRPCAGVSAFVIVCTCVFVRARACIRECAWVRRVCACVRVSVYACARMCITESLYMQCMLNTDIMYGDPPTILYSLRTAHDILLHSRY